jgi:hypothetical protein
VEPPAGAAARGLTTAPPFPLEAAGLGQTRDGLRLELHANSMDSHETNRTRTSHAEIHTLYGANWGLKHGWRRLGRRARFADAEQVHPEGVHGFEGFLPAVLFHWGGILRLLFQVIAIDVQHRLDELEPARDGGRLAPAGIPTLLGMEESLPTRSAQD